jgi:hypothetical protein
MTEKQIIEELEAIADQYSGYRNDVARSLPDHVFEFFIPNKDRGPYYFISEAKELDEVVDAEFNMVIDYFHSSVLVTVEEG